MNQLDLNAISCEELDALIEQANQRKIELKEADLANLMAKAEDVRNEAKRLGVSSSALLGAKTACKIKYRHPDNADLTWSGRGKKPKWLAELLNQSEEVNIDYFLVKE